MPTFDTHEPITATIDLVLPATSAVKRRRPRRHRRRGASERRIERGGPQGRRADSASNTRTTAFWSRGRSCALVDQAQGRLNRRDDRSARRLATCAGRWGSGDIHGDGRFGDCEIKTGLGRIRLDRAETLDLKSGAGDISVDRASGRAEVTAGSGDVRLGALDGSAVVKNSNGDTWVGVSGGDLRVSAANGSIAVDVANAGVSAKSANGDVRVGEVVRGSVVLETKIGDLEVGIPRGNGRLARRALPASDTCATTWSPPTLPTRPPTGPRCAPAPRSARILIRRP